MRTQTNLDFEKLAEFLGVEIKLAQRILTRNDEICWLRSVTAGQDLHATITIPEERNGIKTVRYPRRPDSKAMKTAHQLVDRIAAICEQRQRQGRSNSGILVAQCRA